MIDTVINYLKKCFPVNVSKTERTMRLLVGLVLIAASFLDFITQDQEFWLVVIGWLGVMSGAVSHCPIYGLFGINTAEND
ncbi:DUF2892 domain-containing protein [Pseudomonadota bacterium]